MKKVIVVSKTHLDMGFTDLATNIEKKYLDEFIPSAIATAKLVNSGEKKRFVWTTGSWLLIKALEQDKSGVVREALKNGDIASHAIPFTLHSELLDSDSFDYALSLVDKLDAITGRKTIAAKMTDVPGHSISLVPVLAKHGIKLLHIGVNGASAMPNVPECFLWRHPDGSEVIVIYNGDYGGAYNCPYTGDVLYFDHTVDNTGTKSSEDTIKSFEKIGAAYPNHEVIAGRMDDFAESLWLVKDQLPVVSSEIGDTWIHGAASDPYKTAAIMELERYKNDALASGRIVKGSGEHKALCEGILCLAEHTWGGDSKRFLSDYAHYDKKSFNYARENDDITMPEDILNTDYGMDIIKERREGGYRPGSYKALEATWKEQREYIDSTLRTLPADMRAELTKRLADLRPKRPASFTGEELSFGEKIEHGRFMVSVAASGTAEIYCDGKLLFAADERSPLLYTAFSPEDYKCWFGTYTRNFEDNHFWSLPDFGKPFLERTEYKSGNAEFRVNKLYADNTDDRLKVFLELNAEKYASDELGCPRKAQIIYCFEESSFSISVSWFGKDACRIPELIAFRLFPKYDEKPCFIKCSYPVDLSDIAENGNRRLAAVQNVKLSDEGLRYDIINRDSPLATAGFCNLLRFSNDYPDMQKDGLTYTLFNNIWGTNFPQWYSDNARFDFDIELK